MLLQIVFPSALWKNVNDLPSIVHQTEQIDILSTVERDYILKIINPTTWPQPASIVKVVPPASL